MNGIGYLANLDVSYQVGDRTMVYHTLNDSRLEVWAWYCIRFGLRVSEQEEDEGLDMNHHAEKAYNY